jgi:hypothetical protein
MIIGKGDIASILNDRDDITFFASGVSNSSETRWEEFDREKKLLFEQDKDICLLYFSSIAIDIKEKYDNSKYLKHKKEMEDLIKSNFKNYIIIRIGNISWGSNPNTFLNYIKNKIKNKEVVHIMDEYKFMLDKKHVLLLTDNLPSIGQFEISVFGQMKKVKDLL